MRDWLIQLRLKKDMTQEEVAEAVGIKRSYYSMIEKGIRNPSVSVAKRIAKTIGCKWTNFFDYDGNKTKHINVK